MTNNNPTAIKKHIILLIMNLLFLGVILAQKAPVSIGKLDKSSANIESCEFYPEAKAMYLVNYGTLKYRLVETN